MTKLNEIQGIKNITDLQKMVRKFYDEREWDHFHDPKDLSISLSLELTEIMEHLQWKNNAGRHKKYTEHAK